MLDPETLNEAIAAAGVAAKGVSEYKSETFLGVLLGALLRDVAAPEKLAAPQANRGVRVPVGKRFSASELFASKRWNTETEKIILAAHFLERYAGKTAFTIADVRGLLLSAKVSSPKNVSLALLQSVQKGWLMEAPSEDNKRKAWSLTQTGERQIELLPSAEPI